MRFSIKSRARHYWRENCRKRGELPKVANRHYRQDLIDLQLSAILHVFDNYPANNDVLSIHESDMTILQEERTLGVLGELPFTGDLFGFRTSKDPNF